MVGILRRWNKLNRLLDIRFGPGAAVLPQELTRLHVEFCKAHPGPRTFWKTNLRRLKYHNPSVPIIVNRTDTPKTASLITMYFRTDAANPASPAETPSQPESSLTGHSPAQPPTSNERVVKLDMKRKNANEILAQFMSLSGATPVKPTPEEDQQLKEMAELIKEGEISREKTRRRMEEIKREEDMLKKARAGVANLT